MHPFLIVVKRTAVTLQGWSLKGPFNGRSLLDSQMAWFELVFYYFYFVLFVFQWDLGDFDSLNVQKLGLFRWLRCSILHNNLFLGFFKIVGRILSAYFNVLIWFV